MKIALYIWTAVVLVTTHWPQPDIDLSRYGGDKTAHLAAYGMWGMLAGCAFVRSKGGLRRWLSMGMSLGALDELTQPLFARHADWFDWFADIAGLCLGLLAAELLRRLRHR